MPASNDVGLPRAELRVRLPALWLREAEDVGTAELCDRLNVTPPNAWAILHRARTGLRKCLTAHWFGGGGGGGEHAGRG